VAWPSLSATLGLPLEALGALLVPFTAGYLVSSSSSGHLLARMRVGSLLTLSVLATAASLFGFALAPSWWVLVVLSILLGLGGGAIDAGLNTYAAGYLGARALNWLHASCGVGATLSPLLMTGVLTAGLTWRWGYALAALAQALLALVFGLTRGWWAGAVAARTSSDVCGKPAPAIRTLRLPLAWLGVAVFFLYTGVEVSAGQWGFTLLSAARGLPVATAGAWVSAYWGSLTLGRVLFGTVPLVAPLRVLRLCLAGVLLGATLLWLGAAEPVSLLGLVLMGLALAPIFPFLIATTPERLGPAHAANAIGFQVGAATLGGTLIPAGVGLLAGRAGLEAIPSALLVAAGGLFVLHEGLAAARPRAVPGEATLSTDR
jgi:fucose permease